MFYLIKKDTFFFAVKTYVARNLGLNDDNFDESKMWTTHDKFKALKFDSLAKASKFIPSGFAVAELDDDNRLKIVKG